jgi:hypothetical protein
MLRAEGEAQAITTVFGAIHAGEPDQALLAYQYMQMLPSIARGDANKVWIVPSELNKALEGLGSAVGQATTAAFPTARKGQFSAPEKVDVQSEIEEQNAKSAADADKIVQAAIAAAADLEKSSVLGLGTSAPSRRPAEQQEITDGSGDGQTTAQPGPAYEQR